MTQQELFTFMSTAMADDNEKDVYCYHNTLQVADPKKITTEGVILDVYNINSPNVRFVTTYKYDGKIHMTDIYLPKEEKFLWFIGKYDVKNKKWITVKNPEWKDPYALIEDGVLKIGDIIRFADCLGEVRHVIDTETISNADGYGLFFIGRDPAEFIESIDERTFEVFEHELPDEDEEYDDDDDNDFTDDDEEVGVTIVPLTSCYTYYFTIRDVMEVGANLIENDIDDSK